MRDENDQRRRHDVRTTLRRLAQTLARLPIAGAAEPHVHFHRGPDRAGYPAPCFDPDCSVPRIDA
jgi:hypothetical protein